MTVSLFFDYFSYIFSLRSFVQLQTKV